MCFLQTLHIIHLCLLAFNCLICCLLYFKNCKVLCPNNPKLKVDIALKIVLRCNATCIAASITPM